VDCKFSIPSSNLGVALILVRGYGGTVDTTDLKSVDLFVVRVQVSLPPIENFAAILKIIPWKKYDLIHLIKTQKAI
jgi:hypothetical protein